MKIIISIVVLLILFPITFAQQQTNWQNYANMENINAITIVENGVWAVTSGGAFYYNFAENSYKTYNKSEGLLGRNIFSVAIDHNNKVWFGSANGTIDIYNPQNSSFRSILDIFNSDKTNKSINNISAHGDSIFISTDFGISVIDANNFFFYDTYFKFGSFTSNIKVNHTLITDLIYAATQEGVAIQKPGAVNLSAPESWNVYNQNNGLPPGAVNKLVFYNGNLLAATNLGLSVFNGSIWQTYLGIASIKIIDMIVEGSNLYLLTPNKVFLYDGNILSEIKNVNGNPTRLAYSSANGLIISSNIGIQTDSGLLFPNGPAANQFPYMIVDKTGNLWSASGKDISGKGLYKFDGLTWETYNTTNHPELFTNAYYSVFCSSDNTIYAGSWGEGFVKINSNGIIRYHSDNTPMVGINQNNKYVVVPAFAEDSKSNLWILNLRPADKKSLYLLSKDSVWYSFQNPVEQYGEYSEFKNLVIDNFGTKWYLMTNGGSLGLYYFNEKGTYNDNSDDSFGFLSTVKGLTSNNVLSLAVDRRGDLWVGTNLGVNIITNPGVVLNSNNPQFKISTSFSVRQQTINAMVVDPLNQKWLGTNQGLMLLNSDGTQLLKALDSKNSPLPSDVITSLAIDEKTGRIYVGTDEGLTFFDTPSILPVESFSGLTIFPNPLKLNNEPKLVTIDGLIRNSDIKIISVSGVLIRQFSSPGGRTAFWDGRDENGNLVNSGVYIVIAFDQEGNSVETGKIAVIRE